MNNLAKHDAFIKELIQNKELLVLEDGTVWSNRTLQGHAGYKWRKLNPKPKNGYLFTKRDGLSLALHRIVFAALCGELASDKHINHKDGNGTNNRPDNLELISVSDNLIHRYRVLGHAPVTGYAKLSNERAVQIRIGHSSGESYKQLAKRFRVSKTTIADVVRLRTWK